MEKFETIKKGFFLGIGFIIPLTIISIIGTVLTVMIIPPLMERAFGEIEETFDDFVEMDQIDTSKIAILSFERKAFGNKLLILGQIENRSDVDAKSIQLEAELMDENGKYVYECSEYINQDLKPGEKENFQIKCGCGDSAIPEHEKAIVRVVSVSDY